MTIFKKYKLWYLICAGVFWVMSLDLVLFGLTGVSFINSSSNSQATAQFILFVFTGCIALFSNEGEKHE
jgi:hypothetical protein